MKIADLFVNLGIKGDTKTKNALGDVKSNLKDISSMSLEAKAAILGAVYGLEQLFSKSANRGNDMELFAQATGLSVDALQRYRYAAQIAGASSEELTAGIKTIQDQFTGQSLGEGAVKAFDVLNRAAGGIDLKQAQDKANGVFYVFQKLQTAAQNLPVNVGRHLLAPLVGGDNIFALMREGKFNPKVLAEASVNTTGTNKSLKGVHDDWAKMHWGFDRMTDRLVAKFGPEMTKNIASMLPPLEKVVTKFLELSDKLPIFETITALFKGWADFFEVVGAGVDKINEMLGNSPKEKSNDHRSFLTKGSEWLGNEAFDSVQKAKSAFSSITNSASRMYDNYVPHHAVAAASQAPSKVVNVNVNQNGWQHHGDAKDTHAVKAMHEISARQAHGNKVNTTYMQGPARTTGP